MPRRVDLTVPLALFSAAAFASSAEAAAFTPGNLVVERLGNGATALSSSGAAITIDEYTTAGTLVQSVPLGNTVSESGTAGSDGSITRSADGRFLVVPAYGAAPGTASVASAAGINRVVGRVAADSTVDLTTSLSQASTYSGNNLRGVASTDGMTLFLAGTGAAGTDGVRSAQLGDAASTSVSATVGNTRVVGIYGGQLFTSTGSGTQGVYSVGAGTPTSSGNTATLVVQTATSPYNFFFTDLSPTVGFTPTGGTATKLDTLYVADDGGTLRKYTYSGTAWTLTGTAPLTGAFGLTGSTTDTTVTLFATNGPASNSNNSLVTLVDGSGYNGNLAGTPTSIAAAGTNNRFRGVALAPVAATAVGWRGARAVAKGKGVLVTWATGGSADAGYDVLRVSKGQARRVTVSRALITGTAVRPSGARGGSFAFRDRSGRRGDRYFVRVHGTNGSLKLHGPYLATADRKAAR